MPTENLYEATVKLLETAPRHLTLASIAEGAGVKPAWLSEFSRGNIPDPGVHKVQKLYNFLKAVQA